MELVSKQKMLEKLMLPADQFYNVASIRNMIREEPEAVVRCRECKYNPKNARKWADNDKILFYVMCGRLEDLDRGFCSNGRNRDEND